MFGIRSAEMHTLKLTMDTQGGMLLPLYALVTNRACFCRVPVLQVSRLGEQASRADGQARRAEVELGNH